MLTAPNVVSCIRFLLLPGLLGLAWFGRDRLFLLVLTLSLLTDLLDGQLARWLNQRTELGAKLDSWADLATWWRCPYAGVCGPRRCGRRPCGWRAASDSFWPASDSDSSSTAV
jgi:phosphatidylglycerophosphate synthase